MFPRITAVLVLFAALLQAAPALPSAVSIRESAAIVSVRTERQHRRQFRQRTTATHPPQASLAATQDPPSPFPGFSTPHFQRPPPARA